MHYDIGDIVMYRPGYDSEWRRVRITNRDPDIKNGRPGFDAEMLDDSLRIDEVDLVIGDVWGYDDQIVSVDDGIDPPDDDSDGDGHDHDNRVALALDVGYRDPCLN